MRKIMSKLVTQPSFGAVGQTHVYWQNPEYKSQKHSQVLEKLAKHTQNSRHLKIYMKIRDNCMAWTNFDMLFLVTGFISLVDEYIYAN